MGKPKDVSIGRLSGEYSGMLDAYTGNVPKLFDSQAQFAPQYAQMFAHQLSQFAPDALATSQSASPQSATLSRQMLNAASAGPMNYGDPLPPGLLRFSNQSTRAAQAARGLGYGPRDAYQETDAAARLQADLTDRNRSFGNTALNSAYLTQTDPFIRLLSGIVTAGNNQLVSPSQSFGLMGDLYSGQNQQRITAANNKAQLMAESSRGFDSVV